MSATEKITGTPEGRPGIWLIDSDTAAALIKAAPGDAIHNLLGSGLLLLGADWDKQAAIEHVQREDMRLALVFPPHLVARHHLVAINDEKRWAFDIGPLDESMMVAMEERSKMARSFDPQEPLLNPVNKVYFRAGLIACREYMARFVEDENPAIAASIRANWWPSLGKDFGPPRLLDFGELTEGEYGTTGFRCRTVEEVSPTLEALPIAMQFLMEKGGDS